MSMTGSTPVTPIDLVEETATERFGGARVEIGSALQTRLEAACQEVRDDPDDRAEPGRVVETAGHCRVVAPAHGERTVLAWWAGTRAGFIGNGPR